jgi:hypothetical protein
MITYPGALTGTPSTRHSPADTWSFWPGPGRSGKPDWQSNYRLHYIRTLDKKEIDFVVVRDNRPMLAVEVKSSETKPSNILLDRHSWSIEPPTIGVQVVNKRDVLKKHPENTWVVSIERFLRMLV